MKIRQLNFQNDKQTVIAIKVYHTIYLFAGLRMTINHYTLDYHVTNFNTFSTFFWYTVQNFNPLLRCSYPSTKQNPHLYRNPNGDPNEKIDLLIYMAMLRGVT